MTLRDVTRHLRLLGCPWTYGLRIRLLYAIVFYSKGRYSLPDLITNIVQSHDVRTKELHEATLQPDRFGVLRESIRATRDVPGIIAEFGVFRGESLRVLDAENDTNREIHGFDSFEGLPEDWGNLLAKGYFKTELPTFPGRPVSLHKGLFHETLPAFTAERNPAYSLVHIDCDLWTSTRDVLGFLHGRLSPGAIVIFDEYYGYPSYEDHEYRAWKDYIDANSISCTPVFISNRSAAFRIDKG